MKNFERYCMMILLSCMLFILIIIIFIMPFVFLEVVTSKYMGEINVKCYDRDWNEIQDLNCKEKVYCGIITNYLDQCIIK